MKQYLSILILLICNYYCFSQNFTSSNLPLIIINTNGEEIIDEPKIPADISVIDNAPGLLNHLDDTPAYVGIIGIELRGSSSQGFDKKSYGFETWDSLYNDMDTTMLGLPSEEDWVLHGPWADKAMLRNALSMKISREQGNYSSRTRFCEIFINDDYHGVYLLMEKIKRDDNRLDIAKLNPDEISGDDVTGGYIFKLDWGEDPGWYSNYNSIAGEDMYFEYVYPKAVNIVTEQANYIQAYVDSFEMALTDNDFTNSYGKRYDEYMDKSSFADMIILAELSKDVDGYKLSTFIHKDKTSKGGVLTAGPVWDFDIAWYNSDYCNGGEISGWIYNEQNCEDLDLMPFWWERMMEDTIFQNHLKCRWEEQRQTILDETYLLNYIDSMATVLDEAQQRNYERWDILDEYTWAHPVDPPGTYQGEINLVKQWIQDRLIWMDNNLPGTCYNDNIENICKNELRIFPNPVTDILSLDPGELTGAGVTIYNIVGEKVLHQQLHSNDITELDLTGLVNGNYILMIVSDRSTFVRKIIKQ